MRNNHFNLLKDLILADDQLILADSLSNFHGSDQTASIPSNIKKYVVIRYVRSESIHFINHFHQYKYHSAFGKHFSLFVFLLFSPLLKKLYKTFKSPWWSHLGGRLLWLCSREQHRAGLSLPLLKTNKERSKIPKCKSNTRRSNSATCQTQDRPDVGKRRMKKRQRRQRRSSLTQRAAGNCDCSGEVRRSSDCLQNTVQQLGGRITETCISTLEERR